MVILNWVYLNNLVPWVQHDQSIFTWLALPCFELLEKHAKAGAEHEALGWVDQID